MDGTGIHGGRVGLKRQQKPVAGSIVLIGKTRLSHCRVRGSTPLGSTDCFGFVAHLGERLNGIEEVRGSSPLGSTIVKPDKLAATSNQHAVREPDKLGPAMLLPSLAQWKSSWLITGRRRIVTCTRDQAPMA